MAQLVLGIGMSHSTMITLDDSFTWRHLFSGSCIVGAGLAPALSSMPPPSIGAWISLKFKPMVGSHSYELRK